MMYLRPISRDVPSAAVDVIERMLTKSLTHRTPSAEAAREAINEVLGRG